MTIQREIPGFQPQGYIVNVGTRIMYNGETRMVRFLDKEGIATFFDGGILDLHDTTWIYAKYPENGVLWEETRHGGIRLRWTVREGGRGTYLHSCTIEFGSMGKLFHYFNLAADPNSTPVDVPRFDLNGISCVTRSFKTMHFHNGAAMLQFREVLEAQDAYNEE